MNDFDNTDPFSNRDDPQPDDAYLYDPTRPEHLRSFSGNEIPPTDPCRFVSGTRHASLTDIGPLTRDIEPGSIVLPTTIPLLNQEREDPLSRSPVYGCDLVFQSSQRTSHIAVFGPTGSGKNTTVIDPLRFSAIMDPSQTVVNFSLKASDYGPIHVLCAQVGKKLVVVNLNDPWRSVAWNPLDTTNSAVAIDCVRRFADSVKNPLSNDSEFWNQWIKTALSGAWQAGYRSFPAMYELFSLASADLQTELRQHDNPSSHQLARFLAGGSYNADTVLASIIGALGCFISDNVKRVMANDELRLKELIQEPVCLHVEMPETSLETQRVLYQMLAKSVTDTLIDNAETSSTPPIPATIFFDDMPSLGRILSPERMLTMRSRGIGIVAGVQGISSLELAYGPTSRALIDNFHTKIVLPGGPATDASFFAQGTGEQLVTLPASGAQHGAFVTRPLISAAQIRTPSYEHPLLGPPATVMVGAVAFQAYLQRTYEHPWMASLLRRASAISGREPLRTERSSLPRRDQNRVRSGADNSETAEEAQSELARRLTEVKKQIGWEQTIGTARRWWESFENENNHRLALVLRVAEELANQKATISEFFGAYVYSNTDNIQANLHYLDYLRLKKAEASQAREKEKKTKPEPD